jgi:hypothetical protein
MPGTCVGVEATNLTGHPGDNHHDPRPTEAVAGFLAGAG